MFFSHGWCVVSFWKSWVECYINICSRSDCVFFLWYRSFSEERTMEKRVAVLVKLKRATSLDGFRYIIPHHTRFTSDFIQWGVGDWGAYECIMQVNMGPLSCYIFVHLFICFFYSFFFLFWNICWLKKWWSVLDSVIFTLSYACPAQTGSRSYMRFCQNVFFMYACVWWVNNFYGFVLFKWFSPHFSSWDP